MNTGVTNIISQTFVEDLHTRQEIAKREFAKLQKVDDDKRNKDKKIDADKKNQERLRKKEKGNNNMVFNYLLRHFPEVMVTKDRDPELLRQKMGNSEFMRIFKAAKRFYGFRAVGGIVMMAEIIAGTVFGIIFSSDIIFMFLIFFWVFWGIPICCCISDFLIKPYCDSQHYYNE